MGSLAPQRPGVPPGSTRTIRASFAEDLYPGELLTGSPTVTEEGSSDLTITGQQISDRPMDILGSTIPTGQVALATVSGMQAGVLYTLKFLVVTDASPAQTLIGHVQFTGDSCRW